jgi:hypothetical protein
MEEDAPQVAKTAARGRAASQSITPSSTRPRSDVPVFVTSRNPSSVPTMGSDVLRGFSGGISVNVYVSPFGVGIRHLVNNRYIIAHAASTLRPYSNVVSVARGPREFSGPELTQPAWKVWLCNDANVSRVLKVNDTEQIPTGWHNFRTPDIPPSKLVRFDHWG